VCSSDLIGEAHIHGNVHGAVEASLASHANTTV